MSTVADEHGESAGQPSHRLRFILRVVAGLAALASIAALWSAEHVRVQDDLQLFAEPMARPGETLALRALLLRHVEAPAGPALSQADVRVRLLDSADRELASAQLHPTQMDSMEGALRVPDVARGKLRLRASVIQAQQDSDADLSVQRSLHVLPDAPPGRAIPRSAGALQHYALGRVRAWGAEVAPSPFEPRVISGSCVPEQRCTVLVWVGEPAAAIILEPSAAFTQLGPVQPAGETSGLVAVSLRVHGAEAEVTLRALRAGRAVADRTLRLPVALGEATVHAQRALVSAWAPLAVTLFAPPGREHLILDTFVAGRWSRSQTVAHAAPSAEARLVAISNAFGIVRVQARSDRYSAEGSGTRVVYVQRPGEDAAQALASIARALRTAGMSDGASDVFERQADIGAHQDPALWAAFLLAPFELSRMPIPPAVSGRPARLARMQGVRTFLRFGVGAMLVCCAFVVGVSLFRTGLAASEQAGSILDAAEGLAHSRARSRFAGRMRVLLWVALVCMAFFAAALLIVAKPMWF